MAEKQLTKKTPKTQPHVRLTGLSWLLIAAILYVIILVIVMLKQLSTGKIDNYAGSSYAQFDSQMSAFMVIFGVALVVLLGIILYFQVQNRKEKLLELSKDEFVSLVSHQLRSPLTSIRLFVEMMQSGQAGKITNKQRDYLDNIGVSTSRMIELVNDFLNIASLELGQLNLNIKYVHLEEVVQNAVDLAKPLAQKRGQTILYNKPSLPEVAVDSNLYGQIVGNLINNAITYGRGEDQIVVELSRSSESYKLSVTDNGIGIPRQAKTKVFERFYRAENAKRCTSNGSGLGLYLVKKIVDMSGGNVWFDSVEGQGTSFYLTIPTDGMNHKKNNFRLK